MDSSGGGSGNGKSPNTSLSFRYIANNEELEELFDAYEEDPPASQVDVTANVKTDSASASPKKGERTPSILDKYFKSIRASEKSDKEKEDKSESKGSDESRAHIKEVSASPMKEYLHRLSKKSLSDSSDVKEVGSNETWKIFHDFKYKIAQAVEDMKTRSLEETKEKSVPRDNSISDSEDNSAIKDSDQSVGDTDNQVSSLNSSIQNLSELTQPLTAKLTECEMSLPYDKTKSNNSDDTQMNIGLSEATHLTKDVNVMALEVESGVEALEDGLDGFPESPAPCCVTPNKKQTERQLNSPRPLSPRLITPPEQNQPKNLNKQKPQFFTFYLYFLTFLVFVSYVIFPESSLWNGFLIGIWAYTLVNSTKYWIMETYFGDYDTKDSYFQLNRSSAMPMTYTIPSVKEHTPVKKYEGWINHYRFPEYDPYTYCLNHTTTAFMKLEGCNLRISYTRAKIPKRALWDEKLEKVEFYQHRLYNLTGARIILLPKGLVKRRQWSKKYPICIILNENEKIQVLEKENKAPDVLNVCPVDKKKEPSHHDMETAETNTSPEKKKKFVWRRKDKSPAHSEPESGKEGLRHRLASRKKHKEKKTDSSTCTDVTDATPAEWQSQTPNQKGEEFHDAEPDNNKSTSCAAKEDAEEEIDENELTRIKEFLEEAELEEGTEGASEGEWSLHVRHSKDRHAYLYIFTRTGRDKHEWYRRISKAIVQSTPPDTSVAEDKPTADVVYAKDKDDRETIEMAVYKLSEKDPFKTNQNKIDVNLEPSFLGAAVGPVPPPPPMGAAFESDDKTFWAFLLKIIDTHKMAHKANSEIGVMCQLEPSPKKTSKSKKKSKEQQKADDSTCECRLLPAEVTWLNTVVARTFYDIARNPVIIHRLQTKIQRKLHTLKLPSFMSPLVVTELSLRGACPLVERVCAPSWDERGVWLDADLRYDGGAYISILTQINLMKLKEKNVTLEEHLMATSADDCDERNLNSSIFSESPFVRRKPAVYDSEAEDSAESSEDEETPPLQPVDSAEQITPHSEPPVSAEVATSSTSTTAGSSKKKFLRMVDKIATNKYFQQVTDYKYVKRAMEGLSNTDIKLQLDVQGLEGRIAVNLPPPPHDRVWLGFRTNPQLVLKARPAVGARTLRFAHVTNWIEQKLSKEFEKILVLPNMEDFIIDMLTPTPVEYE